MFQIISKDLPYFLQFYTILVIAFGSALSVLVSSGQQHAVGTEYGFLLLMKAFWTLIQMTVNLPNFTYHAIDVDRFPSKDKWLADLLITGFYMIVVIVMLNLLIALMSRTYDDYSQLSEATMLIAKYDVMDSYELTMTDEERMTNHQKYSVLQGKISSFEEKEKKQERYHNNNNNNNNNIYQDNNNEGLFLLMRRWSLTYLIKPIPKVEEHRYGLNLESLNLNWFDDKVASRPTLKLRIVLFLIDPQLDCYKDEEGEEANTRSATEFSKEIAAMIEDYGHYIQDIVVSLESRHAKHITHANCWRSGTLSSSSSSSNSRRSRGRRSSDNLYSTLPPIGTEIMHADVMAGKWRYIPGDDKNNYNNATAWAARYTKRLESTMNTKLKIRDDHCLIGSRGHSVIPVIQEALQNWTVHSNKPVTYFRKGE